MSSIDYTSRDYQAYKQLMLDVLKEKMPEYTDLSETDAGVVIIEALANGLDICSYYNDAVANDVILSTTQDRKIACILARNLGYTPYTQTASVIPIVFTLEDTQNEDVVIPKGTIVSTEETEDTESILFETTKDLIIPSGNLGNETDTEGNYMYTVNAKQGETVEEDYIGSSNGTAYQTFTLSYSQVLLDSLEVYVNEGDGEFLWTKVNSFVDCSPMDKVYIVTVDENDNCIIEFGNNIKGKIPSIFDNGISASYRVGGGIIGNVKKGTVTFIESSLDLVSECVNLDPIILGHDKETLEEIKYNAPANWRTRDRAVTLSDYDDLIRINVPRYDSFYAFLSTKTVRDTDNYMKADVYYMLKNGYVMDNNLFSTLNDFLNDKIMFGTTYDLFPFVPYHINISGSLVPFQDYNESEVKEEVISFIHEYFKYGNILFGAEIVKSELEDEIRKNIDGVRSFRINTPSEDIIIADEEYKIITLESVVVTTQ